MKIPTALPNTHPFVAAAILLLFALSTMAPGQVIPFFDDFEDGDATDGKPVVWLLALDNDPAELEVVNGDYVVTPQNLVNDVSSYVGGTPEFPDNAGDVSVRTELRLLRTVESAGVYARGTPEGSYFAGITPGSQVFVGTTDGTFRIRDTSLRPLEPVVVQLDVQEVDGRNRISVTAWQSGDPMPARPLLSFNDTLPPRLGSVGVFVDAHDTIRGSVAFGEYSAAPGSVHIPDTWIGDSNLDREFNTSDLIQVFQAGEYEDGVPMKLELVHRRLEQ